VTNIKPYRLVDLLDKFALAAKIVEDDVEGTAAKFKNTYPRTDQKLITRATSFHNDSAGLETEFNDAGMDTGEESHAEATGGMIESFRKAMALSSRRDKRIRMKYRDNAAKLAAWTVASHLNRAPKNAKKPEPTT